MRKNAISVLLCLTAALIIFSPEAAESQSGQTGKTERIEAQRLEGRWLRPDGGYILELRDIKRNGQLKAAYFNPRPIKVFAAKWNRKNGAINLFLELRDINYPGSKYKLKYDPLSDALQGTYFQAVERQTFEVRFVRVK